MGNRGIQVKADLSVTTARLQHLAPNFRGAKKELKYQKSFAST
jgi:hypothetical protein